MSELDLDTVRHTLSLARKHGFAEVELSIGEDIFQAKLLPGPISAPASAAPVDLAPAEPLTNPIKSTLVGYYREAKTPLVVGRFVKKGDVVATIAALGIANDIESPYSGEIVEVLVQPDQPVEYGQPLALVRPQ
ncbi:acetyl-CoA carboxylase biotin carboxyl carrier protein [Fimbriimonas ginsengisoli]|uniref:Biotin carboxyl carrier protein of acetyl-CoA carboxylase n=1 Tax=Fimbriimonas ginsengisoli Gsoil 348 TaxID=661478 RepID=A0A068NVK1_FIMGI|nr:biotin/lipoyl-containing protein [Fimbriimonas ginsengisoli]AIE86820.1 Biotin carboxyl carrier protein of acetyl-CoA carboxylase [Fimbriimonas ginsengisoli Gsoil 348]